MKVFGCLIAAVFILSLPRASAALQVHAVPFETSDLIVNPADGRLYASVPGTVPVYGNTVTAIDPETGALGPSIFVGSEPGKLALSDDGKTLYVALQGAAAVRVVDLSTQTAGLQFNLGSDSFFGPYYPEDLAVQPGHPNVVAISLMYPGVSPRHAGVAIYDNGVMRPLKTQTHTGSNRIEFSSDPSRIYGYNNETTEFGFRRLLVTDDGVTEVDVSASVIEGFSLDILFDRGRVYATSGRVVDPEAGVPLGTFPLPDFGQSVAVDSDRAYYLTGSSYYGTIGLHEFDSALFTPVLSQPVPGATGTPRSLVRWGTDGLAFRTEEQVLLLTHIHEPPTCDLELTQTDSGDPIYPGSFSYNIVVRNQGPSAASEVVTRDRYPAGTTFQYAGSSGGYCSDSSGTVVCPMGTMGPGDSASVTLYLYASVPGTLENTAWVSTATLDTRPENNTSTETTLVKQVEYADINVRQSHSPSTGTAGGTLTFTLNVANAGPDNATVSRLFQQCYGLPFTFVSALPTRGTCSGDSSGNVSCQLGTMAAGESAQVVVTLIPNSAGYLTSYVSGGSDSQDPNYADNYSNEFVEVRVSATTLIANLIDLVGSYQLRRGQDKILIGKLGSAQTALAAEDTSAACASLADFRQRLGKLVGKGLTLSQAFQLDTDAGSIASALQCGSGAALAMSMQTESHAFSFRALNRPGSGPARFALYLPASARARLDVFDVSGRLVQRVHDQELPAGPHELTWDGRSSNGVRAPAGVYFLRLSAGSDQAVARTIVLR
jgi:uncharacterized repeat protein (TIGR01451 family)